MIARTLRGLAEAAGYLSLNPVPPLWNELRRYDWSKLRADAVAAMMVAIVTIPQAIGFAVVVGIPVQAVLATAIVGGAVCAFCSTSHHLVFGPTNTISIILAGSLLTVQAVPLTALQKVLVIGFMMGGFQLAAGFFKLGDLTHFVSRTVIVAYSTAVGLLIGVGQIGNLLGLGRASDVSLPGTVWHIATSLAQWEINMATAGTGLVSLLLMVLIRRMRPNWPDGLIVVALSCVVAITFGLSELAVPLVRDAGEVAGRMPLFVGFPTNEDGVKLLPTLSSAALAAAILGMLETISITKSLAARSGQKIDPNQELIAMGAGNMAATAFGAMPGSSSFVRSAVCYQSGARTQLAAILSSACVLAILIVTASVVNYVPVATLAAYLILIAVRLINREQIGIVCRTTRSDAAVFWGTLAAALFLQLDTAIYVGIGLSLALFLRKAGTPSLVEYAFDDQGTMIQIEGKGRRHSPAITIVHVEGDLFFGAAELFNEQVRLMATDENIKVVILRMKNARHLDATAVFSLLQLAEFLRANGRHLLMSGISVDVQRVLRASGAWEKIGENNIFPAEANLTMSTRRALLRANTLLKQAGTSETPELRICYNRNPERPEQSATAPAMSPEQNVTYDFQI